MASSRAPSWSHEEILAVIRVWSDQTIQVMLDGATRNADIYKKIAERLEQEGGFQRTHKQCKEKLKNLRQFYKDLKDGHNRSGFNRDNWPYYDLIDAVLGDRPATRPQSLVDTTSLQPSPPEEEGNTATELGPDTPSISTPCSGRTPSTDDHNSDNGGDDGDNVQEPSVQAGQPRAAMVRGAPARKRSKKAGIETALSSITETFLKHQQEMEERMLMAEERRHKSEMERLEKMRKEDREHELRLFQILGQMMGTVGPPPPLPQYYMSPPHPPTVAMPSTSMPPPHLPDNTPVDNDLSNLY